MARGIRTIYPEIGEGVTRSFAFREGWGFPGLRGNVEEGPGMRDEG